MTRIEGTTTMAGLIGSPLSGSPLPRIYNAAFAELGLDWAYVPLPVEQERIEEAVYGLRALGFAGANVTMPYKSIVIDYLDEVDPVANEADEVDTIVVRDGRLYGSSTDGPAVTSLVQGAGEEAAVLGKGGDAKAIDSALRSAGARVRMTSQRDPDWLDDIHHATLIVNATPVKESLLLDPLPHQKIIDLVRAPDGGTTPLIAAAREAGCPVVVDGFEFLVRQCAVSFERWTGAPAPLKAMRAALRD